MNELSKDLLSCIDLEKLSIILVEEVVLGSLKKVADDSANKFDDAAFAMLAPLVSDKAKEELKKLIEKLKA